MLLLLLLANEQLVVESVPFLYTHLWPDGLELASSVYEHINFVPKEPSYASSYLQPLYTIRAQTERAQPQIGIRLPDFDCHPRLERILICPLFQLPRQYIIAEAVDAIHTSCRLGNIPQILL
ncbi:hypothetical protein AVEN_224681-1 [Araneus ventricosus]|uniref:Secreted protein n=1 Tax=Araneus ventricosus TaxID=182803 RepID=A0A4Y2LQB5_ARAVE|nr:hypothetical protein AVEN_224681-1 [Araneus ventricosus]